MAASATYTHGHHASVLRSHTWRTAVNSAAFILPHLKPHMAILDVGCGPGTITTDLATYVPQGTVTALDCESKIVEQASSLAKQRGITNMEFFQGDIHALQFPDASFDVVFAHQVLQHVGDPITALREMKRVTKPGGFVAARDSDYESFTWFPDTPGLKRWQSTYCAVASANGGEPAAGRKLHHWARLAGYDAGKITKTASVWVYSTPDEVAWWSGLWAERLVASSFAKTGVERGIVGVEELERLAGVWREWGTEEDAWFSIPSGEILCRV